MTGVHAIHPKLRNRNEFRNLILTKTPCCDKEIVQCCMYLCTKDKLLLHCSTGLIVFMHIVYSCSLCMFVRVMTSAS